jgi:hypothetical protein
MHPTSFRTGDMTIHRIVESEAPFVDAMEFLPGLTPEVLDEHRSWLEPAALEPATGKLIFCIQSYLVRTPHHVVLIDSCVGNDKNRPTAPSWHMKTGRTYMSALARRCRDRRPYPFTLAGPLSRAFVQTRLQSTASGLDPPCIF